LQIDRLSTGFGLLDISWIYGVIFWGVVLVSGTRETASVASFNVLQARMISVEPDKS
jgi:hypothetical protein